MKRFLINLLTLSLLLSFSLSAAVADASNNAEIVDPQRFTSILSEYEHEFALIEQETGVSIHELTESNFELIKTQAVDNLDNSMYRFGELMDSIVRAKVDYAYDQSSAVSPLVQDRITTVWYPAVTLVEYCPLSGKVGDIVPKATTETKSLTVSISVGTEIKGTKLTIGYSGTKSVSVSGPAAGATLYNGMVASHNIPVLVTYGSVVRKEWDSINIDTGKVVNHGSVVTVDGAEDVPCVSAANVKTTVYVDSPVVRSTSSYSSLDAFRTSVKTNPDKYLGN